MDSNDDKDRFCAENDYQCPSCDTILKPNEIQKHIDLEIKELNEMPSIEKEKFTEMNGEKLHEDENHGSQFLNVLQKVQRNRQSRMKLRNRKRHSQDHICPVCNLHFPQDKIYAHIEVCLKTNGGSASGEDSGDESFEEYTWAGQKRIRASSLLQGGYASIGIGVSLTNHNNDDEDEDLNVDEDDTEIYGPAQYAESDVIAPINSKDSPNENDITNYMRSLITGKPIEKFSNSSPPSSSSDKEQNNSRTLETKNSPAVLDVDDGNRQSNQNHLQIIDSLKAKLRLLENQAQNKYKCLICLDDYKNPAISVSCWHVHCEECWLRSLGTRKLCPQCNLITSPADLRRIYM